MTSAAAVTEGMDLQPGQKLNVMSWLVGGRSSRGVAPEWNRQIYIVYIKHNPLVCELLFERFEFDIFSVVI